MRILYLEDEAIIALETAEVLRDIGFGDVAVAYSLDGAERQLNNGLPDLALLDVNLGNGRTSFDLGNRLLDAGVPVVYATGYAPSTLPSDERAVVIEKPLSQPVLERTLQTVICGGDSARSSSTSAA